MNNQTKTYIGFSIILLKNKNEIRDGKHTDEFLIFAVP